MEIIGREIENGRGRLRAGPKKADRPKCYRTGADPDINSLNGRSKMPEKTPNTIPLPFQVAQVDILRSNGLRGSSRS